MPEFWTKKVFNLPRWAWAGMIAGGIGVGLYLRHRNGAAGEEAEEEGVEGYLNSGQLMPPGAPIEGGGGGGGTVYVPKSESSKPEVPTPAEEHEAVEVPESGPAEEPVVEHPGVVENTPIGPPPQEPVHGQPIAAPGTPGIGPGHPAPGGGIGVGPGHPAPAQSPEHDKAVNEINRLQGEIDQLQARIVQLTNWIQAHPNAKDRGQWEQERNQAHANAENKRGQVEIWRSRL